MCLIFDHVRLTISNENELKSDSVSLLFTHVLCVTILKTSEQRFVVFFIVISLYIRPDCWSCGHFYQVCLLMFENTAK